MNKTPYMSFGQLHIGESFIFFNPWVSASPKITEETELFTKISPRKYRTQNGPDAGREWQATSKSGVYYIRK